uniref:Ribosomal protein S4 n=1 Tax=Babesia orientalis TaxID=273649 RepID=A0A0M4NGY8_9APIC|nr:ribosomal protein S4 [Babesia orientalis]ALE29360.1 ribosomal protein S4 [Babesia orientalis]
MKTKLTKIKILKKFNLYTLHGFTNKLNLYYTYYKKYVSCKSLKTIKLLKTIYNLKHKKLKDYLEFNIYKLIDLLKLLKSRIDNILLEADLFITLNHIRQNIIHKHILLNNKIIINYSYIVRPTDIVHILNCDYKKVINIIIYNYLVKNVKIHVLYTKICKTFKHRKYVKNIIINKTCNIFANYICYKNFKVQINNYKNVCNASNTYLLNNETNY